MNGEALIAAFQGRGFDYKSSSDSLAFLNDAYLLDICEAEDWAFLEASAEGASPLAISDLRSVEYVTNPTQLTKLVPIDRREVTDYDTDLSTAGTPGFYYLTEGTTINAFPVSAESLYVRYYKTPPALTGSTSPVLPTRFHNLIVDAAVVRGYEDSDDWELARNAEEAFQRRLMVMREALLAVYRDGPSEFIAVTDPDAL